MRRFGSKEQLFLAAVPGSRTLMEDFTQCLQVGTCVAAVISRAAVGRRVGKVRRLMWNVTGSDWPRCWRRRRMPRRRARSMS
nr:hypothetical protein [Streptomyces sp. AC627_RSS907]